MIGLSIDLDFFSRELPEWDFGHSENFSLTLNNTLWAPRYAFYDLLEEAHIRHADIHPFEFFERLIVLGFGFSDQTRIGASWTHKDAFAFFHSMDIDRVVNVDAHHDCGYGDIETLNCGNWAYYLNKEKSMRIQWVRPKWQKNSGEPDCPKEELFFHQVGMAAGEVAGIFISQSPAWVPPHNDVHYAVLLFIALTMVGKEVPDFDGGMVSRGMPDPKQIKAMKMVMDHNMAHHCRGDL